MAVTNAAMNPHSCVAVAALTRIPPLQHHRAAWIAYELVGKLNIRPQPRLCRSRLDPPVNPMLPLHVCVSIACPASKPRSFRVAGPLVRRGDGRPRPPTSSAAEQGVQKEFQKFLVFYGCSRLAF